MSLKSKCCNAPLTVVGDVTKFYCCQKCGKPTDPKTCSTPHDFNSMMEGKTCPECGFGKQEAYEQAAKLATKEQERVIKSSMTPTDDTSTAKKILAAIFASPFILLVMAANVLLDAFVMITVWRWLIVPSFGVAEISYAAAVGISSIGTLVTHQSTPEQKISRLYVYTFLKPFFILAIAWCSKCLFV